MRTPTHRLLTLLAIASLSLPACEPEEITTTAAESAPEHRTRTRIADPQPVPHLHPREVWARVSAEMHDGRVFQWTNVDDATVFAAGVIGDSLFSYGYWHEASSRARATDEIGLRGFSQDDLPAAVEAVLTEVAAIETEATGFRQNWRDLLAFDTPDGIPQLTLRLASQRSIALLRAHAHTRYLEPMGYDPEQHLIRERSSSGCDVQVANPLPTADYVTVASNVKSAWNFDLHRVREAWATSQGAGIGIEIIDTGSSDTQENLGSQFASGQSSGRSLTRVSTLYSGSWWWRSLTSPHDPCGHGTQMSGLAAAPRGSDGNAVGVAYRANLTIVRAVDDVVISSSNESAGVRDALVLAGNTPATRVVSMSIGSPFSNSTVADGIYYAYNRGKLLLAAAGTSLTWTSWYGVIFPANLPQTVAVTGVKEGLPLERCSSCHDGSEVDFVIHMARRNDPDRTSLTLAPSGDQPAYVGGSSAATATTAGIAALVWSATPGLTREQVIARLRESASLYPARSGSFGWGVLDARAAVPST